MIIIATKLSDFTERQLRISIECFLKEQAELRKHVEGLRYYGSLSQLMDVEILEYEAQIDELMEIIVQFHGALKAKEAANRISDN